MSIFVNAAIPMYSAAVLAECGQMDARARSLELLVRRWAKDRSVCHASEGHLSPYQWSLLVIYFRSPCCARPAPSHSCAGRRRREGG